MKLNFPTNFITTNFPNLVELGICFRPMAQMSTNTVLSAIRRIRTDYYSTIGANFERLTIDIGNYIRGNLTVAQNASDLRNALVTQAKSLAQPWANLLIDDRTTYGFGIRESRPLEIGRPLADYDLLPGSIGTSADIERYLRENSATMDVKNGISVQASDSDRIYVNSISSVLFLHGESDTNSFYSGISL
jgi:hypothetical protein